MKPLAFDKKHETKYCIPLWLRDEQIKHSLGVVKNRVQPAKRDRADSVAVVCYGPSLKDTWQEIRKFKNIFTCSGAHKFLLSKGIKPKGRSWWHVDVDPRKHKVELLGKPQKGVHYFASSTCHPDYFKALEGFDVSLWHVFDTSEQAASVLPRGEWCFTGGSNVGMRAMVLARFQGFVNIEVFGMDGCFDGHTRHAGEHPNPGVAEFKTDLNGKTFITTPSMLECAKQIRHEVDMLPDANIKFHGSGLVQEIMKDYARPSHKKPVVIAVESPELISAEYKQMNEELHRQRLDYGTSGHKYSDIVFKLCQSMHDTTVLDYGCGKGYLAKQLPFPIWEYDPAIPTKAELPRPANIVVCTDVLEHVEPEKLMYVLADLRRVTKKVGFFVVHLGPSKKNLPDGRNSHLIQKPEKWWVKSIGQFFSIGRTWRIDDTVQKNCSALFFIVGPRLDKITKSMRKAA